MQSFVGKEPKSIAAGPFLDFVLDAAVAAAAWLAKSCHVFAACIQPSQTDNEPILIDGT